jgi:hypothetical protein
MTSLEKLASIASATISRSAAVVDFVEVDALGPLGRTDKVLTAPQERFLRIRVSLAPFPRYFEWEGNHSAAMELVYSVAV